MKQMDEFDNSNPHFMDFIYIFYKSRKVVGILIAFSLVVGFLLTKVLDKQYSANITFVSLSKFRGNDFNSKGGDLAALSVVMATAAGSFNSTNNSFYLAIIESNSLKDLIIKDLELDKHYSPFGVKNPLDARGILEKNIIAKDMKSGIVQVRVKDRDPVVAAKIANLIPVKVNEFLNSVNFTDAQKHETFLKNRLELVQKEMQNTKLEREAGVKEALYLMLLKEYELARANSAREKLDVQIIDPAEVPEGPSFPRLIVFEVVALAISIFLSVVYVVSRYLWTGILQHPRNAYLAQRIANDLKNRKIEVVSK